MLLKQLFFLLLVVCTLCVVTECQEDDIDRHDVHRVILKPTKSKKHKKRTKSSKSKFRPNQQISAMSSSGLKDNFFEPTAHASSTSYHPKNRQRYNYPNHHDEYHDLINPKPPRHGESSVYNYPEEDPHYQGTAGAGSSNHQSYVPYLQNSDWNPIPATQLTHDYRHFNYDKQMGATATSSNVVNSTKKNKRKKPRRKPVQITTMTPIATTTTTTVRPMILHQSYHTPQTIAPPTFGPQTHIPQTHLPQTHIAHTQPAKYIKPKNLQQHHYVNYNHKNKSHIKYEVSGTSTRPRFHQMAQSVSQPPYQTIHLPQDTKPSISNLSYEVFERPKDYNKQIKQTNFKSTLVPQPIYPKLYPFLPTVSTYMIMQKTNKPAQLDFGKRDVGFANLTGLLH